MDYISAKTIISQYKENNCWFGTNYTMNIYKGCCHGCIYCDSRSQCYGINDFDNIKVKENAIEIIKKELRGKRKTGVIGTGAMSDPYNSFEKNLMLTRKALEEINNYNFGVAIMTKSNLITRDIDILNKIKEHSPVIAKITITTYDDELCSKIEPNVCVSSKRLNAIKELSTNGIFTGVLLMPILPFINDTEQNISNIIRKSAEYGAKFIYTYGFGVTLRQNQRDYFYSEIIKNFHNKNIVQSYKNVYKNNYECYSNNSNKLWEIFKSECEKHKLLYKMEDIIKAYKSPYDKSQISWF